MSSFINALVVNYDFFGSSKVKEQGAREKKRILSRGKKLKLKLKTLELCEKKGTGKAWPAMIKLFSHYKGLERKTS